MLKKCVIYGPNNGSFGAKSCYQISLETSLGEIWSKFQIISFEQAHFENTVCRMKAICRAFVINHAYLILALTNLIRRTWVDISSLHIVLIYVMLTMPILGTIMMTSSNGNIFRVTGPLCGEFTGPGEFPAQKPVTLSFDVFFDLRLNKQLSKQPWGWWLETLSWSLWRHRNVIVVPPYSCKSLQLNRRSGNRI